MAITIDFSKEFADLICIDVPTTQVGEYPHSTPVPEKYRKSFIHPENGFAKQFCEDYDKSDSEK